MCRKEFKLLGLVTHLSYYTDPLLEPQPLISNQSLRKPHFGMFGLQTSGISRMGAIIGLQSEE